MTLRRQDDLRRLKSNALRGAGNATSYESGEIFCCFWRCICKNLPCGQNSRFVCNTVAFGILSALLEAVDSAVLCCWRFEQFFRVFPLLLQWLGMVRLLVGCICELPACRSSLFRALASLAFLAAAALGGSLVEARANPCPVLAAELMLHL